MPVALGTIASHRTVSVDVPTYTVGRDTTYGGNYNVLQWDPASLDQVNHEFQAKLVIPAPADYGDTTVYLDDVDWNSLVQEKDSVVDGTMFFYEWMTVEGDKLAAMPVNTVYTLRFDGTALLVNRSPSIGPGYSFLWLPPSVPNWQDGLVHPLAMTFASNVSGAEEWDSNIPLKAAATGVTPRTIYTAPMKIRPYQSHMLALKDNGFPLSIKWQSPTWYVSTDPCFIGLKSGANYSLLDAMFLGWMSGDGESRTATLLIPDYYTASNLPGTVSSAKGDGTGGVMYPGVYKTGGVTQWTGAELFTLKNQSITLQYVGDRYIMGVA